MLLEKYKENGYLFNINLTGKIEASDVYRGDLVLEFGGKTERGDQKPPSVVAKQAVLLIENDKIVLLAGGLDQLSDLAMVAEHYQGDLAEGSVNLFFVHNIKEPMVTSLNGTNYILVPLDDGMIWNELLELLCIEKSDIKKLSAEEKVVMLYKEFGSFKHKYPDVSYEDALGLTVAAKAAVRGAV